MIYFFYQSKTWLSRDSSSLLVLLISWLMVHSASGKAAWPPLVNSSRICCKPSSRLAWLPGGPCDQWISVMISDDAVMICDDTWWYLMLVSVSWQICWAEKSHCRKRSATKQRPGLCRWNSSRQLDRNMRCLKKACKKYKKCCRGWICSNGYCLKLSYQTKKRFPYWIRILFMHVIHP